MASKLVIQLQNSNGDFSCEKYDNLPSSQSAYITICFTDNYLSEQYALNLKDNLIKFISKLEMSFIKGTPWNFPIEHNLNQRKFGRLQNGWKLCWL